MGSLESYSVQLKEIEGKFNEYKKELNNIIGTVSSAIHHTTITKGEFVNPTPYYNERMGTPLKGKVLQSPVDSNDCMKYHYDHENRIIMVEEYSLFLKKFLITDIYLYHELTERLHLSSGRLVRLFVFDHGFSDTKLCLSYAERSGYCVEEFIYADHVLEEIRICRDNGKPDREIHRFIYEKQRLIQIERICQNGYRGLLYTTKRPDFGKIKQEIYRNLKELITEKKGAFAAVGIEGFIDQHQPMLCVCFTKDPAPSDLIADWNTEMHDICLYDWQFKDSQEKKCAKVIAEIIVELAEEGLLQDKQIYFHQSQVCAAQLYSGVKAVFRKASMDVK